MMWLTVKTQPSCKMTNPDQSSWAPVQVPDQTGPSLSGTQPEHQQEVQCWTLREPQVRNAGQHPSVMDRNRINTLPIVERKECSRMTPDPRTHVGSPCMDLLSQLAMFYLCTFSFLTLSAADTEVHLMKKCRYLYLCSCACRAPCVQFVRTEVDECEQ